MMFDISYLANKMKWNEIIQNVLCFEVSGFGSWWFTAVRS